MRTPRTPLPPLIEVVSDETVEARRATIENTPFAFLVTRFEDGTEVGDDEFPSLGEARTAANAWLRPRKSRKKELSST